MINWYLNFDRMNAKYYGVLLKMLNINNEVGLWDP